MAIGANQSRSLFYVINSPIQDHTQFATCHNTELNINASHEDYYW